MKMNRIIATIILGTIAGFISAIINSCTHNPQGGNANGNTVTETNKLGDFRVKVVDNCEYLEYEGGLGETAVYSMTHKGNCKNCHFNLLQTLQEVLSTFK